MFLAWEQEHSFEEISMLRLAFLAVLALAFAGCASEPADRSASGGASATTQQSNQDMRGSKDIAPGAEGDRRRPDNSAPPSRGY
jgi:hypothetical protein